MCGMFLFSALYIDLQQKNPDEIVDFCIVIVERPLIFVERPLVIVERPLGDVKTALISYIY